MGFFVEQPTAMGLSTVPCSGSPFAALITSLPGHRALILIHSSPNALNFLISGILGYDEGLPPCSWTEIN
jgi:hypothetical protein